MNRMEEQSHGYLWMKFSQEWRGMTEVPRIWSLALPGTSPTKQAVSYQPSMVTSPTELEERSLCLMSQKQYLATNTQ